MRLRLPQAVLLRDMLAENRHRLVIRRADARDQGKDLWEFQRDIEHISDMQEELERVMDEIEGG